MLRRLISFIFILAAGSASALASVDTGLLALVPAGSRTVAAVDVNRARNSQFGQFLMNRVDVRDSNFEQFLAETGFDPSRDLQDFVFAAGGNSNSGGAILARGNFDLNRIEAAAKSRGASIETYRGVDLILNSGHKQENAVAFPAAGIAVMADVATLEGLIRNQGAAAVLDPALQQLIAAVGPSNDAWFASVSENALSGPEITRWNPAAGQALRSIIETSAGARFGDPIALTVNAVARSPEDAAAIANVIRGLAGIAQMQRQSNPYLAVLASVANTMNVAADGNAVHLTVSIPEKDAEQLASFHPHNAAARPH